MSAVAQAMKEHSRPLVAPAVAAAAATAVTERGGYLISDERLRELFPGRTLKEARKQLRNLIVDNREPSIHAGPTERPANVRIAEPNDEDAILALLRIDCAENAEKVAPVAEERILQHIQKGTRREGGIVAVIDAPNGEIVATVGIFPAQWWWSNGWFLQEFWSFTHPDHRRGNHAAALIAFSKWASDEWTRLVGYRLYLLAGVLATQRVSDKVRFYSRHMTRAGVFTVYPTPPDFTP